VVPASSRGDVSKTLDPFFSQVEMAHEEDDMLKFCALIPSTKRNQLYVRSAYKVIYKAAMAKENENERKYAIVTGTPGIGKSAFLYYVFWRMVKAKKRVFFITTITQSVYFDGANMLAIDSMPLRSDWQFWTNDLWCLIDSADPIKIPGLPVADCSILLATSPRRDHLGDFKKLAPPPAVFYMPLWSHDELKSITGLYPAVNSWENRFKVLGGVPHYVLQNVLKLPESILRLVCNQCSLDDGIRVVSTDSEFTEKTLVVQNLIHLHSKDPYTEAEVRYASPEAVCMIVHVYGKSCYQKCSLCLNLQLEILL